MSNKQDVTTKETGTGKSSERQQVLRPDVDIYENREGLDLFANLPGVRQGDLRIEVDDKTLTIQGEISIDMPESMQSLYADVRSTRYQRAFTLSSELDAAGINASLVNGLLKLHIPKREEVKPRRIEVTVG
jgi:HSP20 family molecular chaperone IbpA